MQLEKVNVTLDEKNILRSVDFTWRKGEAIALIGANGAGKSTLLKVLASLIKPVSGKIGFPQNMDLQQWRRSIGTVFPETFLYESLTPIENLNFYRQLYGMDDQNIIKEVLGKVGLLQVRHEWVRSFSKGMKQRLSIARALIHKPSYMILDEPFDGLDFESKEILEQLLIHLKAKGVGWTLVSHDLEHAWTFCDRAVLIHQGRIVAEDKCNEATLDRFLNHYRQVIKEKKHAFF